MDLLTLPAAASLLGVTRQMVHLWTRDGTLPSLRVSAKLILVERADVLTLKAERENSPGRRPSGGRGKARGETSKPVAPALRQPSSVPRPAPSHYDRPEIGERSRLRGFDPDEDPIA